MIENELSLDQIDALGNSQKRIALINKTLINWGKVGQQNVEPSVAAQAHLKGYLGLLAYDAGLIQAQASDRMTAALEQASRALQDASKSADRSANRMMWLTVVLAALTLVSSGAAVWQGLQSQRQADAAEKANELTERALKVQTR